MMIGLLNKLKSAFGNQKLGCCPSIHHRLKSHENMSVYSSPFPYFVHKNFLPDEVFQDLLRFWPKKETFNDVRSDWCEFIDLGLKGSLDRFNDPEQVAFWKNFAHKHVVNMIPKSMSVYAAKAINKYRDELKEITLYSVFITEATKQPKFLNIHTHHINAPTYIGTCVFYVDDNKHTVRGTTIYGVKENLPLKLNDYVDLCSELDYEHRTELELKNKLDFIPNTLLSMCDSPISFHAVDESRHLNLDGPRKMITVQWGMDINWFKEKHGITTAENWDLRKKSRFDKYFRKLLKEDVANFLADANFTEKKLLNVFSKIRIKGFENLDFIDEPLLCPSVYNI